MFKTTVLIATANRYESVSETVEQLIERIGPRKDVQVLLVENGGDSNQSKDISHPAVQVLVSNPRGKSLALNRGLEQIDSDIIIFTDDDVSPGAEWLSATESAFDRNPDTVCVCGPIIPLFPHAVPKGIDQRALLGILFAYFDPCGASGPLPQNVLPLGPNFAVRREAIVGMKFRTDLGTSEANGPLNCDEAAFLTDLRARFMPLRRGGGFFFEKNAIVRHRIRTEQTSMAWMCDRFFSYGKSLIVMRRRVGFLQSPSLLITEGDQRSDDQKLHAAFELHYYLGQIAGLVTIGDQVNARFIADWILASGVLEREFVIPSSSGREVADMILADYKGLSQERN